jgi:hypothetical protein
MHAHSSQLKRFVCAHVCMFALASCEIQHWEKKRQCLCVSLVQHTCAFIITKDVCHVFFLCVCTRMSIWPAWVVYHHEKDAMKVCWFICVLRVSKIGCVPTSEFQVVEERRPRSYFAIFVHQHMHRGGSFALKGFGL